MLKYHPLFIRPPFVSKFLGENNSFKIFISSNKQTANMFHETIFFIEKYNTYISHIIYNVFTLNDALNYTENISLSTIIGRKEIVLTYRIVNHNANIFFRKNIFHVIFLSDWCLCWLRLFQYAMYRLTSITIPIIKIRRSHIRLVIIFKIIKRITPLIFQEVPRDCFDIRNGTLSEHLINP